MASNGYIPDEDDAFDTFLRDQLGPYVNSHFAVLGLTAGENTTLQGLITAWGYAWTGFTNAQAAFHGSTQDKDLKRKSAEAGVRLISNKVQANPAVTNLMKESMGITVRKTTRTPSPIPTTTPMLQKIDTSTRGILRLFFADSTTPEIRKKPDGVAYCEIREVVQAGSVAAPTDPEAMPLLANDTRAPYRADYEAGEIGKSAYFALRWVNTRGQFGPWSQIYSAIVPS